MAGAGTGGRTVTPPGARPKAASCAMPPSLAAFCAKKACMAGPALKNKPVGAPAAPGVAPAVPEPEPHSKPAPPARPPPPPPPPPPPLLPPRSPPAPWAKRPSSRTGTPGVGSLRSGESGRNAARAERGDDAPLPRTPGLPSKPGRRPRVAFTTDCVPLVSSAANSRCRV